MQRAPAVDPYGGVSSLTPCPITTSRERGRHGAASTSTNRRCALVLGDAPARARQRHAAEIGRQVQGDAERGDGDGVAVERTAVTSSASARQSSRSCAASAVVDFPLPVVPIARMLVSEPRCDTRLVHDGDPFEGKQMPEQLEPQDTHAPP